MLTCQPLFRFDLLRNPISLSVVLISRSFCTEYDSSISRHSSAQFFRSNSGLYENCRTSLPTFDSTGRVSDSSARVALPEHPASQV